MRQNIVVEKTTLICNHTIGFPLSKTYLEPGNRIQEQKSSILPVPHRPRKSRSLSPLSTRTECPR